MFPVCVSRLKKGCPAKSAFHTASLETKGTGQTSAGASKLPLAPLENLPREHSLMMAHKRQTFDPHISENTLSLGNKLPRSSRGNIKEKISLWEGKEPSGPSDQCASIKKTESLAQSNCKTTEQQSAESCRRVSHKEKENLGRENGDSVSCSPVDAGFQLRGTLKRNKPNENHKAESRVDQKGIPNQEKEKENVEKVVDSRPCSPAEAAQQQQVGTLRKSNDRKMTKQSSQDKKAVFTLFKRLEAMGENYGKTPTELGNYFSPPSKDKQAEVKPSRTSAVVPSRVGTPNQENVYTEPGAPPINPVPKPQRTFQHPVTAPIGIAQRQGRGQRNLPPLPSISIKTWSKPPSGVHRRVRGERIRDNINRYIKDRHMCFTHSS